MIFGLDGRERREEKGREEEGRGEKELSGLVGTQINKYHFFVPDQTGTFCTMYLF